MENTSAGSELIPRTMGKTPVATSFFVPGYIPQLDGLRGFAVLMVLTGHAAGFVEAWPHATVLGYVRFTIEDRKSTRLNSSHTVISYAVFCLKKKKKKYNTNYAIN